MKLNAMKRLMAVRKPHGYDELLPGQKHDVDQIMKLVEVDYVMRLERGGPLYPHT